MVDLSQGTLEALAATDVAEFESYAERFVRSVKDGCVSAVRGLSIERSRPVLEQELKFALSERHEREVMEIVVAAQMNTRSQAKSRSARSL